MPSIAKNAFFMTAASIGQKILSFAYFTLIARTIGATDTGKYFFALSFTTIFVVFVDLGFTSALIREASKDRAGISRAAGGVLAAKTVFAVASYAAMALSIHALNYGEDVKMMVYLSGITMILDSIHLTFYGVLRALGDLRFEAMSIMVSQFLTMILGTIFLFLHLPIVFLILAFVIPSFLNVCFVIAVVRRVHHLAIIPRYDWTLIKHASILAWPFTLAAIFARIYSYADTILLRSLVGVIAVGWYSIAYKITFAFQFIPLALVAALYPKLSEYYGKKDMHALEASLEQSLKYLLLIAMPIALGIATLARPIVLLVYGTEYLNSIRPLQILIVSLIFSFASFPLGAYLNACNRAATQTLIVGAVLFSNIVLNLFLIPRFGVVGAASAGLFGNFLLAFLGYLVVSRVGRINHSYLGKTVLQLLLASVSMAGLALVVTQKSSVLLGIVVAIPIYLLLVFGLKAVTKTELKTAIALIKT